MAFLLWPFEPPFLHICLGKALDFLVSISNLKNVSNTSQFDKDNFSTEIFFSQLCIGLCQVARINPYKYQFIQPENFRPFDLKEICTSRNLSQNEGLKEQQGKDVYKPEPTKLASISAVGTLTSRNLLLLVLHLEPDGHTADGLEM